MSNQLARALFAACLLICVLGAESAWRTLAGAVDGPWSAAPEFALGTAHGGAGDSRSGVFMAALPTPVHSSAAAHEGPTQSANSTQAGAGDIARGPLDPLLGADWTAERAGAPSALVVGAAD